MVRRAVADDELLIERTFAAPARLVFDMWANPDRFRAWIGPPGFNGTEADFDFRVGGAWSAAMVSDQYGESRMGGRYLEIEPGRRIVMTFKWLNSEPDPETVITLTFTETDGKTVQSFHQTPFNDVPRRDSHIGGWNGAFDGAQSYVEAQARELAQ